jgi:vesicle transport protein SEC22
MVRLTIIARSHDGLPLAEGLDAARDPGADALKASAKAVLAKLATPAARDDRVTVDAGAAAFHCVLRDGVVFLAGADRGYPSRLAFQYLDELASEFGRLYGGQVAAAARPYAFVRFDTFIARTRRVYADARDARNIAALTAELGEVQSIMTRNIADVLGQGDRLDRMAAAGASLAHETKAFRSRAVALHRQAMVRKYAPLAAVIGGVVVVLWLRRKLYG